jgi:glycolate oxidase FAD binding subunit
MPLVPCFKPHDAATAAAMLAEAAAEGMAIVPHGNRTKLRAQVAHEGAGTMSTARLTSGLAHYAGDLVVTAPAGATLRDVNAALALERQWIPLDPPYGDATIGGIVATNDSGPRRHRFGSPRDLIIGIEVALTNGRVAHSGGRVVKNVAGYDLARLFCGSHGSLGVITSVNFKLAPIAPASRTVMASFASAHDAAAAALELSASAALTPSAVELVAPDPRLLVRFESTAASAVQMASTAAALLAATSRETVILDGDAESSVWRAHYDMESARTGIVALMSVLPVQVGPTLDDVERVAAECGVAWSVTGRAAIGVLRVRATADVGALHRCATALRAVVTSRQGHVRFADDRDTPGEQIDVWGPVGSAAAVGFAVKQRFDPTGVLPYPWARA